MQGRNSPGGQATMRSNTTARCRPTAVTVSCRGTTRVRLPVLILGGLPSVVDAMNSIADRGDARRPEATVPRVETGRPTGLTPGPMSPLPRLRMDAGGADPLMTTVRAT
jgi:hypothetical protein